MWSNSLNPFKKFLGRSGHCVVRFPLNQRDFILAFFQGATRNTPVFRETVWGLSGTGKCGIPLSCSDQWDSTHVAGREKEALGPAASVPALWRILWS